MSSVYSRRFNDVFGLNTGKNKIILHFFAEGDTVTSKLSFEII